MQSSATSQPSILSAQPVHLLDHAIIFMAKWYLLIDALNGFLLQQLGQGMPLSVAYKGLLLLLICLSLGLERRANLWIIPLAFCTLLIGPFYSFLLSGNQAGFNYDISMVVKLLSPVLAAIYFYHLILRAEQFARQALVQIFLIAFLILVSNIMLGQLGFGFTAYQPNDYLPDQNLGTKGFFRATNELSALLLLLTGFLLAYFWPSQKFKFLAVLLAALFCAHSMLTKTAIGGVFLLAVLIPFLQSKLYWQRFSTLIKMGFGLSVVLLGLVIWQLPLILEVLPLSAKLRFTYQQQGILGLVLSSRDLFVIENWRLSELYFSDWHRLFGVGYTAMDTYSGKPLTEIDPADLVLWFGLPGLAWFTWFFIGNLRLAWTAWSQNPISFAAGVLAVNFVLLVVASMAGHVLTSGMLWIPWGMLNGALLLCLTPKGIADEA